MKGKVCLFASIAVTFALIVVEPLIAASDKPAINLPKTMSIATAQPGAAVYVISSAVAKVLTQHLAITVTVVPYTSTPKANDAVDRMQQELGCDVDYTIMCGYLGKPPQFDRRLVNNRVLTSGVIFDAENVARSDVKIERTADIKGLRVCVDYAFPYVENIQLAWFAGLGISRADIKPVSVPSPVEAVKALIENRADVGAVSSGMAILSELDAKVKGRLLNLPTPAENPRVWEELNKLSPVFFPYVLKPGTPCVPKETNVMANYSYIFVNKGVSDEVAYQLVKTLWDHVDEIPAGNPFLSTWTRKTMAVEHMGLPYHPGSIKFFKQMGVWTEQMEMNNNAIMAK